jgi:hypothetical protein
MRFYLLMHFTDFRNHERRDYRKHGTSNYDSDESDGGNSYSNEPNNKVIVRGLAPHITEADVSFKQTLTMKKVLSCIR